MHRGWLDYRKANPAHWGTSMQARLLAVRDLEKDLLPPLQFARVLTIKDGGVLVHGKEIHFRALKSKPEDRLQTWWCMLELETGLATLARMNPKTSCGFHVNDDDRIV